MNPTVDAAQVRIALYLQAAREHRLRLRNQRALLGIGSGFVISILSMAFIEAVMLFHWLSL